MRLHAPPAKNSLINNMMVYRVRHKKANTGTTTKMVWQHCHTPAKKLSNRQLFESTSTTLAAEGSTLSSLIVSQDERDALDTLQKGVSAWKPLYEKYLNLASQKDFPAAHDIMLGEIYPLVDELSTAAES